MLRTLALAVAGLLLLASTAAAEPVEVHGRTLELHLPNGYCLLDATLPGETELIESLRASNAGQNDLIAYFAPCNDLIAYRVGALDRLTEYGTLMVPLVDGAFTPGPGPRADFLAEMRGAMPTVDEAMLAELEQQASNNPQGVQISGSQFLGILHEDANALYLGLLFQASAEGETLAGAAVLAFTLLGDVAFTVNLYRPYRSNADLVALVSELGPYMAGLTAANP